MNLIITFLRKHRLHFPLDNLRKNLIWINLNSELLFGFLQKLVHRIAPLRCHNVDLGRLVRQLCQCVDQLVMEVDEEEAVGDEDVVIGLSLWFQWPDQLVGACYFGVDVFGV